MMRQRAILSWLLLSAPLSSSVALLAPIAAEAQDPAKTAEKLRLEEEMKRLAAKNAWTGVERAYNDLLNLKVELPFEDHYLGAQSARYLGKTYEVYERLTSAKEIDATPEILQNLEGIDGTYGKVDLQGTEKKRPDLVPDVMPFAPDERKSIEWAQTVLANTGSFRGMLPKGSYKVGGLPFTVEAGQEWQLVSLKKVKGGGGGNTSNNNTTGNTGNVTTVGAVIYNGPVITAGYLLTATPAPAEKGDRGLTPHPASMVGSGFALQAGYELGFTQLIAASATLEFRGMFSKDTVVGLHGWLAMSIRPGRLRISFGPTYGFERASGIGVVDYYDIGQDKDRYPSKDLTFKGFSLTPGAELTFGVGFVEFGKFMGVVELGGSWSTDGDRSYYGAGLRVGIVPKVPRFKG